MWECGLKHTESGYYGRLRKSLLMWECGLKLIQAHNVRGNEGHSLCGSVD